VSQNSKITSAMLCVCESVSVCVWRYRNGIQTWIFLPSKQGPVNFRNPCKNFCFKLKLKKKFPHPFSFSPDSCLTLYYYSLPLSLSLFVGLELQLSLAQAVKEEGCSDKISWRSTGLINWSCFVPLSYDVRLMKCWV